MYTIKKMPQGEASVFHAMYSDPVVALRRVTLGLNRIAVALERVMEIGTDAEKEEARQMAVAAKKQIIDEITPLLGKKF